MRQPCLQLREWGVSAVSPCRAFEKAKSPTEGKSPSGTSFANESFDPDHRHPSSASRQSAHNS
jgi:hypothetical protein